MDEVYHKTKWLRFVIRERKPKTFTVKSPARWYYKIEVVNTTGFHLGWIHWFAPWWQYVFDPTLDAPTMFNNSCLQGVVDVLTHLNNGSKCGCGDSGHKPSSWCRKCGRCVDCCATSDCEEFTPLGSV